jgi:predicted ATPase/class 3 adenylate cyclase/Tfp pilus assembly protein PilF
MARAWYHATQVSGDLVSGVSAAERDLSEGDGAAMSSDEPGTDEVLRPDLPRGTVTFLFSDIEGSTDLVWRLGDTYAHAHAAHQALLRAAWADHGGVEVDTQGDAFFVAFPTAPSAVAAAAQATTALAGHPWPADAPIRVRIGLHTGAPQLIGDQYFGLDVHRAARIAAAGHGGQVLLSAATRELAERDLPDGASLRDLGVYRLKDLRHPERLYQLVLPAVPNLPTDFPPLKTLDRARHNLPIQPTPLLDRQDAVRGITALLRQAETRLVTLTGPGGIGKTRLSIQAAAELADDFADGVWFVRLSRLTDPALVVPTIAQTFGLKDQGSRPIADVLRDYLRERRLLLLLDNFEQVIAAAVDVAAMLEQCRDLKMLVTSRRVLRLRGEKEVPVPPLAQPEPRRLPSLERLSQYAAVALFIERARDAKPDFQVTNASAPHVAEICARLDGLPLAIELAAARVRLLPPAALLTRLERRLTVLTDGPRDLEERQQTMRQTLAWSYDLLSVEEQRLFRRLAVFVDGWTIEAVEAVCFAPKRLEPLSLDPLATLGALVDQSLTQQRDEDGEAWFSMLHVVREFALERLETSGEAEELRRGHADYCVARMLAADAHLDQAEQLEWFARLERERNNVRAALRWAKDHGEAAVGLRLAAAMWGFWWQRGPLSEARGWLETFLALTEDPSAAPADVRPRALLGAGELALGQGDSATARNRLEAALTLAREQGDRRTAAEALGSLGILAAHQHDAPHATAYLEESLALARAAGNPRSAARALNNLGVLAYFEGAWDDAVTRFDEALTLSRSRGDRFRSASCLMSLGWVAAHQGDFTRALSLGREALTLFWALGNERRTAEALESLAMTIGAAGGGERAARLLGATTAQREIIGAPPSTTLWRDVERMVAPARARMGEERWAAAFAAGRALTLEEAIDGALDETTG